MKKFIPFLIWFLLIFYALPLLIKSTVIILVITPILILISAIFYGGFHGFSFLLSIICALCALPLILTSGAIFLVYVFAFFIVALLGNAIGLLFRKKN